MSKTWIITGASVGGIGEGIARAVLSHGDNAVITARSLSRLETIASDYPDTCLPVALDMADKSQILSAVEQAAARFGTVDVLVNNAGHGYRSSVEEGEEDAVKELFRTNVFGPVDMIKAVLPIMREKRAGVIMNTTSIAAERSAIGSGYYAASKAALDLLTDGLCKELKPLGIRVMVIEPGSFRTHFYIFGTPLRYRFGIFPEHSLSGTGGIDNDRIEISRKSFGKLFRSFIQHDRIGYSHPFDIGRKNAASVFYDLIGKKNPLARHRRCDLGGLSSGRCTQIQYLHAFFQISALPEKGSRDHRTRILYIVCAGVVERSPSRSTLRIEQISVVFIRKLFKLHFRYEVRASVRFFL